MESVLNELSIDNMATSIEEAQEKMKELILFCKKLHDYDFTKLRLPNEIFFEVALFDNYTLNDWINDATVNGTLKTIFLGLKTYPYFEELTEELEDIYLNSQFCLNEPTHSKHEEAVEGLADAYLRNTLAVSFNSHELWRRCRISLSVHIADKKKEEVQVIHASSNTCLNIDFEEWLKRRNRPPLNSHADVDVWFNIEEYQMSNHAKDDLIYLYQQNFHYLIGRIESLIDEIWKNPMKGTGKPETLKGDLAGWMSRRITQKHRLVYKLEENVLSLYKCYDHYDDK